MRISPFRDTVSALLGVATGIGWVGTAAKKALVNEGDGFGKRFAIGAAATLLTGGAALFPYLIASPGGEARADVQSARGNVVGDRY